MSTPPALLALISSIPLLREKVIWIDNSFAGAPPAATSSSTRSTFVRTDGAMSAAVKDAVARFGDLHVLINSAGITESNIKAKEYNPNEWRKTMDVNLIGAFVVNQAFGQELIKIGHGGSIINDASMSGGVVNYPQQLRRPRQLHLMLALLYNDRSMIIYRQSTQLYTPSRRPLPFVIV